MVSNDFQWLAAYTARGFHTDAPETFTFSRNRGRDLRTLCNRRREAPQLCAFTTCAPAQDVTNGRDADLVTLGVIALGAPEYWLDVEAEAGATLSKIGCVPSPHVT
jgi:hypothetical protein